MGIALDVLPIAFEILALQFFLESFECFRHGAPPRVYMVLSNPIRLRVTRSGVGKNWSDGVLEYCRIG
jgi:hypothetical protein